MANAAILSIKPVYATRILEGTKTIELPLPEIQELVPGFVPPQGILWLRDELGKYQKLLSRLSDPLPQDIFPQQTLAFDLSPTRVV